MDHRAIHMIALYGGQSIIIHTYSCVTYALYTKEVASFRGLSELMGVARKRIYSATTRSETTA